MQGGSSPHVLRPCSLSFHGFISDNYKPRSNNTSLQRGTPVAPLSRHRHLISPFLPLQPPTRSQPTHPLLPDALLSPQVRELMAYVRRRNAEGSSGIAGTASAAATAGGGGRLPLTRARVTSIRPVGMGDRVCVDTVVMLSPGEGLLLGSFARAFFFVHSECGTSQYIASRPFRVNAGAVRNRKKNTNVLRNIYIQL